MTATNEVREQPIELAPALPDPAKKSERNMGVEIFRIVSMLMVVMLHVLGHGGVYSYSDYLSTNYKVAWFLETVGYCSVNCYAIISGFANVKTDFKFRRFVHLWLETVVLILSITAIAHFFIPSVTVEKEWWLGALFPLTTRELWYLCAYFFLYPLIPILNKGLLSLKRWQHVVIIVLLQIPTWFKLIMHTDNYVMGGGYSTIWLICLYVIGAYFRIYGAPKWAKPFVTLPVFFLAAFVAYFKKIYLEMQCAEGLVDKTSKLYIYRDDLISYVSPCMVIMAVALLLFFMQIKVKRKLPKVIIANLAKATWGVFVLHVCSAGWYWNKLWHAFRAFADYPTAKMVLAVFVAVLMIFFATALFTIGKIYLFKLLRVEKGIDFLADLPGKIVRKIQEKKAAGQAAEQDEPILPNP